MSSQELTDGSIIEQVRAGNRELFAQLVDRYHAPLFRLALSRLSRIDWAEDAVQETFFCAFKSLHTYNSRFSFRTWLWTILLNQCRRHLRRIHRWSANELGNEPSQSAETAISKLKSREEAPEDKAIAVERLRVIEKAMLELTPGQADAVRLRFFGHLKFHEIADALNCSLSTAKSRVRVGLQKMGDQFDSFELGNTTTSKTSHHS